MDYKKIMELVGIRDYPVSKFKKAMKVESEHKNITKGNKILTAYIVKAHILEHPRYYDELGKMEKKLKRLEK